MITNRDRATLLDYLSGDLDAPASKALEARLKAETQLADELVSLAHEEALLTEWAAADEAVVQLDEAAFATAGGPEPRKVVTMNRTPWWIAAAACVTAGLSLLWAIGQRDGGAPISQKIPDAVVSPAPDEGLVALLVNEAGAAFDKGSAPDGVQFRPGAYHMTVGAAHLRLINGVDLVFRAPARFEVVDPLRISLTEGSIRAMVPESGHGFTIGAPGVDYEDMGTEFGVSVNPNTGKSAMHVFEGEVNVLNPDTATRLKSLGLGQSVTSEDGELRDGADISTDIFPTPQSIGHERWKLWSASVRQDPDVLLYYPFERDAAEEMRMTSAAAAGAEAQDAFPARIEGARWVTGRWPGKEALLFDRDGDFVEFELPNALGSFTFAAWVKIDRLDYELSALLDSNSWEPGDLHLQVNRRDRIFYFGNFEGTVSRERTDVAAPVGEWVHFAAVRDAATHEARTYVNGKLVERAVMKPDLLIQPGTVRLGDWLRRPDWEMSPKRGLRGRMDEVIIWNRVLSEEHLKEMIESGRPEILWPMTSVSLSQVQSEQPSALAPAVIP